MNNARPAAYSPTDPDVIVDPYPYYAELRQGPSAAYIEVDDLWIVSRFDEVATVFRDSTSFSSKADFALFGGFLSARKGPRPDIHQFAAGQPRSMITSDPPEHIQLRRLPARMFTSSAVDAYRPMIERIAHDLLDDLLDRRDGSAVDLVWEFNFPLPIRVIAGILGIPSDRWVDFKRWSDILIKRHSGEGQSSAEQSDLKEMMVFFGETIQDRKANPGNDLISMMVVGNDNMDEQLSEWDLRNFCGLLLSAGNETTTNLLGNLFNAFFHAPDQLESVRSTRAIAPAVEEILRFDPSVQAIPRLTTGDIVIGDTEIPAESYLLVGTAASNRDERRWQNPEAFDVARAELRHHGFGVGIHHCLGAALARLEMQVALEVFLSRVASIEPSEPPSRWANIVLRGFTSMPVVVTAS